MFTQGPVGRRRGPGFSGSTGERSRRLFILQSTVTARDKTIWFCRSEQTPGLRGLRPGASLSQHQTTPEGVNRRLIRVTPPPLQAHSGPHSYPDHKPTSLTLGLAQWHLRSPGPNVPFSELPTAERRSRRDQRIIFYCVICFQTQPGVSDYVSRCLC